MLFRSIIDPKNFKTYETLKARLDDVNGFSARGAHTTQVEEEDVAPVAAARPTASAPSAKKVTKAPVVEDDDEDLAMFRELADLDD